MTPREELEARLTALLLGELSAEESAPLQQAIAQDAELARLHDRLKQAIGLVRETVTSPEQENLAPPDAPKLSPERRAALLAAFKVIRPKELRKASRPRFAWRELVAVAAMIVILCLAVAIIAPNFIRARGGAYQRPTLYVARDEYLVEAVAPATPLARGEDGRTTVSGKSVVLDGLDREDFTVHAQLQADTTLTTLPTGGRAPQKPARSNGAGLESPPSDFVSLAKPEVESFSVVAETLKSSAPALLPMLPPPPPSEGKQSGERAIRQLAAIALPATAGDALSTSSDDKNNGWAEPGATVIKSLLPFGANAVIPDSGARGGGRGGQGGGGGGLGAEPWSAEYAGVSIAGVPLAVDTGAKPGQQIVTPAPSAKPADGPTTVAFGITPGQTPAGPVAEGDAAGKRPMLLADQDDGVRFKETNLSVVVTNGSGVAGGYYFNSGGVPAQPGYWRFEDFAAGGAGQAANVLQGADAFTQPTLEPGALGVLGDLNRNAVLIQNGTADSSPRFRSLDSRIAGAKDTVEAEKKLAELSKSERLDPATGINTLHFDVEGKDTVRNLQRESGVKSDEKSQVAQPSADGVEATKRFKIALPESERGEAKEKLRVATGPVAGTEILSSTPNSLQSSFQHRLGGIVNRAAPGPVVTSEIMANDPATGLPAQKQLDLAMEEGARRQVKPSPAAPATKAPATQVATVDKLADADSKPIDRPVGDPAQAASTNLFALNRELDNLRSIQDKVRARVLQEKVDALVPKTGIVEVIEAAEETTSEKPSLWGRVRGFVSGDVERTARITVQKDAPGIAGLGGGQTHNQFDPYWVQTESERIQSKVILNKVIEQLNLNEAWGKTHGAGEKLQTEDAYRLLKKKIDVRSDPKSGVVDIRVKSDSPDEAARIANTVAQVYSEARREKYQQMTARGAEALSEEFVKQNKEIARVEQELERWKKEVNPEQADVSLPKLAAGAPVPQPEVTTTDNTFSTFSLNVSDVSFKLAAASLEKGQMPDPATVRSEEFINAFDYRDPEPKGSAPIAFAWERARYPFAHDRDLLRFSVKTAASGRQAGRPLNLVLLLDNSGSMERADRIRIRQECLRVLASQLQPQDRVSVVAFARTPRLWVDGLPGSQAGELSQRVGTLAPEGGTNLEDAMNVAYKTALKHFLANGVNRVVLLTDGAANLGDVEPESLKQKVEAHRKQGVALDCFGIGWDGLNDELLEALSRNGDGRYGFVNTPEAATTEFASQLAGALKVAASDVKVQVQWNPRRVTAYRQIGYAKHQLKKEQFRDNTVDAAEIGAAEAGNALYAVQVDPRGEGPIGTVRVRFKVPGTGDYREHEWTVPYDGTAKSLNQSRPAMRLAASASAFSEWLVSSPFAAEVTPDRLLAQMNGVPETWPADPRPKKLEWMIRQAKSLAGK